MLIFYSPEGKKSSGFAAKELGIEIGVLRSLFPNFVLMEIDHLSVNMCYIYRQV